MKSPTEILKKLYVTEKSHTLANLQGSQSNKSIAKFKSPKQVFEVYPSANKAEIKTAVEQLYREKGVTVTKVNTINTARKQKRRGKGRKGSTASIKKAIVTFSEKDSLE